MIKTNKNFETCFKAGRVLFYVFAAALFAIFGTSVAQAQTAMVTEVSVNYPKDNNYLSDTYACTAIGQSASNMQNVSYLENDLNFSALGYSTDPWRNSALIEFDQPHARYWREPDPSPDYYYGRKGLYPNHCLRLCANVTCANPARKTSGSNGASDPVEIIYDVASSDFPIQSVLFEIFKYQPNSNPYNADTTPPIRTIAMTPQGTSASANTCYGVGVYTSDSSDPGSAESCCQLCGTFSSSWSASADCPANSDCAKTCASTCQHFKNKDQCEAGTTELSFCAAWDGSYEIDGEFGKSNGQFGFRANIQTKWPGDGISSGGDVEVNHTMAYPGIVKDGNNRTISQIPIQVDVTNVHSVRSSSTMVGATTKVPAQPYNLTYKLSKDATTTITISDPGEKCLCSQKFSTSSVGEFYSYQCSGNTFSNINFNLIAGQPRIGEGIPNGTTTNLDAWDGRDVKGNFLPYGNYLASITASTYDEWSAYTDPHSIYHNDPDLSRTVTRQISLDPLKITDIKETGLAKLSTSYAKIDYVLTESATVHVMIFTPSTHFDSVDMPEMDPNNYQTAEQTILNRVKAGVLVDHIIEQKQARVNVNTKWDGICRNSSGCNFNGNTYATGTPMPDGDYVYVMWAEIPYPYADIPNYNNTRQVAVCINGKWWDGVKTHKYYNGILPINRGLPEITVGTVGYTSLGSSPTAFGLDPFTFNFAVSRDSIVDATIKTTANDGAAPYTVRELLTNEVAVSAKENKVTWDGLDKNGRYVSPGNYMIEIVAKDSLYPAKQSTMTVQFPVDLFRVVDVKTEPLLDEATSQAKISYTLSKSMDVTVEIYNTNVRIPTDTDWCVYNQATGVLEHSFTTQNPLKVFTLPKAGEGMTITEIWDGLNTTNSVPQNPLQPLPDGNYPYRICARTTQSIAKYYDDTTHIAQNGGTQTAQIIATDKPTGYITISRGSIAFNKISITPSTPTLKYSTETVYLPSYEVAFSTSRAAKVQMEVRSTVAGQCMGSTSVAGTVCRTLSAYSYNTGSNGYFDPTKTYKVYWDGKDSEGNYVKYGSYEVRLTGDPYPAPSGTQPQSTIYRQTISVNNFQVYDRYVEDITRENPNGKFAYQISVPMKVAIQIFKPGTTTNRNTNARATGLVNPVGNTQVATNDIKDVLVKSIVGIRPNLVSLDEVWDGTDYAGQEVPDGIYPYRYVTVMDAYDMDSVTGAVNIGTTDTLAAAGAKVADWEKYITLEHINVARGDSWYADVDWKSSKATSFFPNPFNKAKGYFEITKLPAPGKVSIKIYNIAGDLVRDGGYDCFNAKGEHNTLEEINAKGGLQPYMNLDAVGGLYTANQFRNFTLRCEWNKENNHGKKVARGLYYAIMELDPTRGNAKKSQRIIKILIP